MNLPKFNKPMAAITTLAGSNGYIIANWYILSISDKAVFPPLNFVFGATAFVALDLAMVAVVFSEPEKDWLGWFLTVATIATTCAFSGGIAWHLFGDLWHTAFAAAQFMIALHVTHDRKLSYRTRAVRDEVEQALQVAVTERGEMEQALQQAVMERGEMEQALQIAVTERGEMEQALQVAVTERGEMEEALQLTQAECDELSHQVEQAVTARNKLVTGRAGLAEELQQVVTERDKLEQALLIAQTERNKAVTSRAELATSLQVAVTERFDMARSLEQAVTLRDELEQVLAKTEMERDKFGRLLQKTETERDIAWTATNETVTNCSEVLQSEGEVTVPGKRGELESLPDNQQQMIQIIAENPKANYQEIADVLGVTKTSVTRYKTKLEQLGLISRNGTWKVHV